MTDMTDKLSFINRDDKGYIIGVGNLVGCSYAEARKRADGLEEKQGDHYEIIKDEKIFQIIQYFVDKEENKFMADKDDWDEIVNHLDNMEDDIYETKKMIANYIETIKEKEV